jgi:hypothetical protein
MEFNRNTYFMIGVILVLLGIQLRMVDSFVLNRSASDFVETRMRQSAFQSSDPLEDLVIAAGPKPLKTIAPPDWMGWALISVGAVMGLHCVVMRKSG